MSIENTYPKPMSDFSLPRLKDIPTGNRKAIMSEEWEEVATKEMMSEVRNAEKRWKEYFHFLYGRMQNESEIQKNAQEWSQCVSTIILSFHHDVIAVSESRNMDTRQLKEAAWSCASALEEWSEAIDRETNPRVLRELAREGVEFLKSHDMTPKDALLELQLVVARKVKERMGI